jgi:hypothetical protein
MMFQKITKDRTCPVCKSPSSYRVKRAGLPVKMVCSLLNLRPHWCPECDTFYLGPRRPKDPHVEKSFRSGVGSASTQGGGQPQPGSVSH